MRMPDPRIPSNAVCPSCGRTFILSVSQRCRLKKNRDVQSFCNADCYHRYKIGSGNPKWRGGKTMYDGYIYRYSPHHPHAIKKGYVAEHRLVMESIIGRFLLPEESVHHIDGNKENNLSENLMLMESEGKHRKLHAKYRTFNSKGFDGHLEGVQFYL